MSKGIGNNLPRGDEWLIEAVQRTSRDLQETKSARVLEAAQIRQGGLQVTDGGSIIVNPDGPSIEMKSATGSSGLLFRSADPGAAGLAALIALIDQGVGSPLVLQAIPNTAGDAATLTVGANGGISMQIYDTPTGSLAQIQMTAGKGPNGAATIDLGLDFAHVVFYADQNSTYMTTGSIQWVGANNSTATPEWRAQTTSGAYIPIRAASFPVGSSRDVKTEIADVPFDALAAVMTAPAQQWRYRETFAQDPVAHISPMAEDLPADLVAEVDGVKTVDLTSLVGTLWQAVTQLTGRVHELQQQVAKGVTP